MANSSTPSERPEARISDGSKRIVQLITAAPNWWARYYPDKASGHGWSSPIACWALIEDGDGVQRIVGVDPTSDDYDTYGDVIGQRVVYYYSNDTPSDAEGATEPPVRE